MNLNEMTIGQAKEIAALFGNVTQVSASPVGSEFIGKKVIVRSAQAGVHYGTLKAIDGQTITLTNSRRLWYWVVADKKGISLSDVAEHGIGSASKVCASIPEHIVLGACEIMTTTEAAQKSVEVANDYRP